MSKFVVVSLILTAMIILAPLAFQVMDIQNLDAPVLQHSGDVATASAMVVDNIIHSTVSNIYCANNVAYCQ